MKRTDAGAAGEGRRYIRVDEKLRVGFPAIADGFDDDPVEVLRLGRIFARVRDIKTGYEWELMANRLTALQPQDQTPRERL